MRAPSPAAATLDLASAKTCDECRLKIRGLFAEELLCQLQRARGVGDYLHGLDARDIVEEPAAAGVHELRVALHLHQLQSADPLRRGEFAAPGDPRRKRSTDSSLRSRMTSMYPSRAAQTSWKSFAPSCSVSGSNGVAQLIEGLAQGRSPLLVPTRLAAVAAAVGAPALNAVRAAPRGVVDDFALALGRKLFEEAGVVGQLDGLVLFEKA